MTSTGESATDDGGRAVRIEYLLTADEYAKLVRWGLRRNRAVRLLLGVAVFGLAFGVVVVAVPADGKPGVALLAGYALIGLGALCVLLLVWGFVTAPRRLWEKRSAGAQGLQVRVFSDAGVRVETVETVTTAKWGPDDRTIELDDAYLIGTKRSSAFGIVPKRAFSSPADEQEFRRLVEQRTTATLIARNPDA